MAIFEFRQVETSTTLRLTWRTSPCLSSSTWITPLCVLKWLDPFLAMQVSFLNPQAKRDMPIPMTFVGVRNKDPPHTPNSPSVTPNQMKEIFFVNLPLCFFALLFLSSSKGHMSSKGLEPGNGQRQTDICDWEVSPQGQER